jgi:hypothetical protein
MVMIETRLVMEEGDVEVDVVRAVDVDDKWNGVRKGGSMPKSM